MPAQADTVVTFWFRLEYVGPIQSKTLSNHSHLFLGMVGAVGIMNRSTTMSILSSSYGGLGMAYAPQGAVLRAVPNEDRVNETVGRIRAR